MYARRRLLREVCGVLCVSLTVTGCLKNTGKTQRFESATLEITYNGPWDGYFAFTDDLHQSYSTSISGHAPGRKMTFPDDLEDSSDIEAILPPMRSEASPGKPTTDGDDVLEVTLFLDGEKVDAEAVEYPTEGSRQAKVRYDTQA